MNPIVIPFGIGLKGFMKFECFKADWLQQKPGLYHLIERKGTRRLAADWMPNKILDAGRNIMADRSDWLTDAQIGTDNTLPTASHTQLLGWIAGTSDIQSAIFGSQGSAPWYGWKRTTYRFPPGAITNENLSEAGVGWGTSGATLISRALIVDGAGDETTVTPITDEYLDMTHELRYYPPEDDVVVINGVTLNSIDYDLTIRASSVGSALQLYIGQAMGQVSVDASYWNAWDGLLGTIEQAPNGLSANCDNANQFNLPYINNSYYIDMQTECGQTGWILVAGMRCLRITTTAGNFQIQFDSNPGGLPIPKDINYIMTFVFRLHWAEAVIP